MKTGQVFDGRRANPQGRVRRGSRQSASSDTDVANRQKEGDGWRETSVLLPEKSWNFDREALEAIPAPALFQGYIIFSVSQNFVIFAPS